MRIWQPILIIPLVVRRAPRRLDLPVRRRQSVAPSVAPSEAPSMAPSEAPSVAPSESVGTA